MAMAIVACSVAILGGVCHMFVSWGGAGNHVEVNSDPKPHVAQHK